MEFSKSSRAKYLKDSDENLFDLIIIGGGITGAGIALDASSRGLSVLLIEKDDFAEGTSSRSTKLVHGGLRYLKNLEFGLVRDSGRERAILYQNAPHIVYPQKMMLPIYKGLGFGKTISSLGLWFYDVLAGVEPAYQKQTLNIERTLNRNPILKKEGLKGSIQYYEYRTNDARLVIENLKKANEFGALALNYCEAVDIERTTDEVRLSVLDKLSGGQFKFKSKMLINATGVWSDGFLKKQSLSDKNLVIASKGTHLVVSKDKLSCHTALYFELEDNRMIFAIPKDNKVYIGTTEEAFQEDLDEVYPIKYEVEYLIKAINGFLNISLNMRDVEVAWSGLRSLVLNGNSDLNKVSRKEKIIHHFPNVISILGGKLTAYRLMSEKIVDQVVLSFPGVKLKSCQTKTLALSGSEFDFGAVEPNKIIAFAEQKFYESYQLNLDTEKVYGLFYTYGKNIDMIINKAYELYNQLEEKRLAIIEAEIWYSVNYEMCVQLSDFMMRRTERFLFAHKESQTDLNEIVEIMAKHLDWKEEEKDIQLLNYHQICTKSHSFLKVYR